MNFNQVPDYTTPSIGRMFFYRPVVNRYLEELALLDPAQGLTQPVGSEEAVQTWINTKKQLLATKLAVSSRQLSDLPLLTYQT